jgi:hypothetical protein
MKSNESSHFRWSAGTLQKAVKESVESACKKFGLEWDSFHSGGERIGEFEYVDITRQIRRCSNGTSVDRPQQSRPSSKLHSAPPGKTIWLTTVTTSDGFSEAYTLPGDDETAFDQVRNCVSDRLKEIKANG